MTPEQRMQFLKDEYFFLQSTYEDFDRRALTIKSWAIPAYVAGIAVAYDRGEPLIWEALAVAAAVFWYIEAKWKVFQYAYQGRIRELEAGFAEPSRLNDIAPLQITRHWFADYRTGKSRLPAVACQPFVALPHLIALVVAAYYALDTFLMPVE